jgi:hypothetical protein
MNTYKNKPEYRSLVSKVDKSCICIYLYVLEHWYIQIWILCNACTRYRQILSYQYLRYWQDKAGCSWVLPSDTGKYGPAGLLMVLPLLVAVFYWPDSNPGIPVRSWCSWSFFFSLLIEPNDPATLRCWWLSLPTMQAKNWQFAVHVYWNIFANSSF